MESNNIFIIMLRNYIILLIHINYILYISYNGGGCQEFFTGPARRLWKQAAASAAFTLLEGRMPRVSF